MAYTSRVVRKILKPALRLQLMVTSSQCNTTYTQKSFLGSMAPRSFGFLGEDFRVNKNLKSNVILMSNHSSKGLTTINMLHNTSIRFSTKHPFSIHQKYFSSKSITEEVDTQRSSDLQEIQDWIDRLKEDIYEVPTVIEDHDLEYLCTLESNRQRRKFLRKLFKKEQIKLSGVKEKDKKKTMPKNSKTKENDVITDDANFKESKTFILNGRKQTMQNFDKWRLAAAMKFGADVALDFIYDKQMTRKQVSSVTTQLDYVNKANMLAKEPFHLHFVNCDKDGYSMTEMKRKERSIDNMMVDVTSQGLLDIFQQDDIIYLCPDSKNIIKSYDASKVYVLPALCSEGTIEHGAIIAQVKKLNVAHGRFYGGFPNLAAQVNLLIAMNGTRDFAKAFKMTHPLGKAKRDEKFSSSRAQRRYKWDINR